MKTVKILIRVRSDLKELINLYAKSTNQSMNSAIIELIKNGYIKSMEDDV